MQRLIWLTLFCLAGIGGLLAIRTVAGPPAVSRTVPDAIAADVTDAAKPPLMKGDRLPSRFIDNVLPKPTVETVKIAPTEAPKQSDKPKDDLINWHWHEGGKIVRRRQTQ